MANTSIDNIIKNLVKIVTIPVISAGLLVGCASAQQKQDYSIGFSIQWKTPYSVQNKLQNVDSQSNEQNNRTQYFKFYEKQF